MEPTGVEQEKTESSMFPIKKEAVLECMRQLFHSPEDFYARAERLLSDNEAIKKDYDLRYQSIDEEHESFEEGSLFAFSLLRENANKEGIPFPIITQESIEAIEGDIIDMEIDPLDISKGKSSLDEIGKTDAVFRDAIKEVGQYRKSRDMFYAEASRMYHLIRSAYEVQKMEEKFREQ